MIRKLRGWVVIGVVAALVACVTINVYFPEAAAERAADRFIQDVIGEGVGTRGAAPEAVGLGGPISGFLISAAYAQEPNINIDTPQIARLKESMAQRHRQHLAGWFDAGAIGLSAEGLVGIRDRAAVPLGERRNLESVVSAENADRSAVYREIAVANGRPEWEGEIRQTFARQWIANARPGWYYQDHRGNWVQK